MKILKSKKGIMIFEIISCLLFITFFAAHNFASVYSLLSAVFVLPVLFITDICFFIMPFSVGLIFLLSLYTIIKRDYSKFNILYTVLFITVILGISNMNIDKIYGDYHYAYNTLDLRTYWHVFFGIILSAGIIQISKRKDTKIFIYTYALGLLLYITYQIINLLD